MLTQNTATRHIITGESTAGNHGNEENDDEEIPSDFSDEETETTPTLEVTTDSMNYKHQHIASKKHHNEWAESREDYIAGLHKRFTPYRNETISKWNEKLKIASGKMTSKASTMFTSHNYLEFTLVNY